MRKKQTVVLDPVVDDFCALLARILARASQKSNPVVPTEESSQSAPSENSAASLQTDSPNPNPNSD